ncbi:MAG: PDZ domain-containing protein [Gemmataceae bacterium]|nr:PDZ domain-containing protein [Gemmataceae bacterium]
MIRWGLIAFVLCCPLAATSAQEKAPLSQALALEAAMREAIAKAEASVACVLVSKTDPKNTPRQDPFDPEDRPDDRKKYDLNDPQHIPESFGSAVILEPRGLLLTNWHVVQDATKIFVRLSGGKGSFAEIHAADPRSDLAVLKLLDPRLNPLPALKWNSEPKLERGQFVIALTHPFAAGFRDGQPSVSWGIVSNLRRRTLAPPLRDEERAARPLHQFATLIQTDARIPNGASGGALLNLKGELIGMVSSLAAIHGVEGSGGFALPFDETYRPIIQVLLRGEEVDYGFLGVALKERGDDETRGFPVGHSTEGSPAKKEAGLQKGDYIVSVDGVALREVDDLFVLLGTKLAGTRVKIAYRRGTELKQAQCTLAKYYVPGKRIATSLGSRPFVHGMRVDYTSLIVQMPPRTFQPIPPGVLISDLQDNGSASKSGIRVGQIVTHVDGAAVNTPAEFYAAIERGRALPTLTLNSGQFQERPQQVRLK